MGHKVGRNAVCPCGSAKKHKHCHGSVRIQIPQEELDKRHREHLVREFQRKRQQGLGRGIVSALIGDGRRLVAVYDKSFVGDWKTFHDFLLAYLVSELGPEWLSAEVARPNQEQHPIVAWRRACIEQQKSAPIVRGVPRIAKTGAAVAYLGLAYDLYSIAHVGLRTRDPRLYSHLLHRLRGRHDFVGARYEIQVAAQLLCAGFELTWENESDRSRRHCEYAALYTKTGRAFGVECKIRQPPADRDPTDNLGRFVSLVTDALKKGTEHERLVFVDLNTPVIFRHGEKRDWRQYAVSQLRKLEKNPQSSHLPPAYIVVSSFPHHHHLNIPVADTGAVLEGFRIETCKGGRPTTLRQALEERSKHEEIHALCRSIVEHRHIPVSFDGSFPEAESARIRIGEPLRVDDGSVGVVESACVVQETRTAAVALAMPDGSRHLYQCPLSDAEIEAWEQCPETFFGELGCDPKPRNTPLEMYDALLPFHRQLTREQLLGQMSAWPDQGRLHALSDDELACELLVGLVNSFFAQVTNEPRRQSFDSTEAPPGRRGLAPS